MRILLTLSFVLQACFLMAQKDTVQDANFDDWSLIDLCDTFPTDKCPNMHGFLEIYEPLFAPMRQDSIRFFEIGILTGLSHLMWKNYFPNAEVFGIDLKDYSAASEGSGIFTYVADQSDREDLGNFIQASGNEQFDVILDDGGHAMDHQQISLGYLFPHLKPGGMFIIEDVHTSLPYFYPDTAFIVNQEESNTTLLMLERFIRTSEMISDYLTYEEEKYLQEHIERIEIHYRRNRRHSIVCVIHKKEE